jgi:hypothetical protein
VGSTTSGFPPPLLAEPLVNLQLASVITTWPSETLPISPPCVSQLDAAIIHLRFRQGARQPRGIWH